MYDQFGFYSENGFTGAGGPSTPGGGGQRGSQLDFSGFDFSDFASGPGAAGTGGRRPEGAGAGGFRDIFSQFFGGRRRSRPPRSRKRAATSST